MSIFIELHVGLAKDGVLIAADKILAIYPRWPGALVVFDMSSESSCDVQVAETPEQVRKLADDAMGSGR